MWLNNRFPGTITAAEVLAVTSGIDEVIGQPVVCLTLRPITGSGWAAINYSLSVGTARSLLDRLTVAFETSPYLVGE